MMNEKYSYEFSNENSHVLSMDKMTIPYMVSIEYIDSEGRSINIACINNTLNNMQIMRITISYCKVFLIDLI